MKNLFDLTGEVAVVIGGNGVLGGAISCALHQAGASVAIVGRDEKKAKAIIDAADSRSNPMRFYQANATSESDLKSALESIEKELGATTVLVNAAGGNQPEVTLTEGKSFDQIKVGDWNHNFDLNLIGGAFLPCQIFGMAMVKRQKGSVINIASVAAHLPLSRVIAYSSAKAAVLNLTQFLAREWAPHGVRVNSLTPGFFPADQNRKLLFNEDGSPTARAASILGHTPMKRFGAAPELGGAAVFLASSVASSFVTGIDLRVDGGFLSQTI